MGTRHSLLFALLLSLLRPDSGDTLDLPFAAIHFVALPLSSNALCLSAPRASVSHRGGGGSITPSPHVVPSQANDVEACEPPALELSQSRARCG